MAPPGGDHPAVGGGTAVATGGGGASSGATRPRYPGNLPPDFEPTPEERSLLDLYATVRSYEREAARLKERAAKARLAEADERHRREMEKRNKEAGGGGGDSDGGAADGGAAATQRREKAKKKKKSDRKKKKKQRDAAAALGSDDDESMSEASDESDDDADADEEGGDSFIVGASKARTKKARKEYDDDNDDDADEEERLREEHLGGATQDMVGQLSLKKKRGLGDAPAKSLVSSMEVASTPPHDFSKKLGMSRVKGTIMFPELPKDGTVAQEVGHWSPPKSAKGFNDGALTLELKDFDSSLVQNGQGNNTIAIKFTAPEASERFSLNIAGPGHQDYHDVLFHFNPRHHQKGGQLLLNDKQDGTWGQSVTVPLSQVPLLFGQASCTLILQVNPDGFDVFLEGKHCARLEHRTQLPPGRSSLFLHFPSTDDYGSPENWTVYKVWWGHKDIMAGNDLTGVAGVNVFNALHPRKLFISGLKKISTEPEVELRRAELERAFRKYGGAMGAIATVPTNSTFAFVELESERQTDLALTEMQSSYRMNRARRTKHEALQEQREAAEAAAAGKKKDSNEWD